MNFSEKISRIFKKVDALMPVRPINLARKKFMALFVEGLIKGRSVQFVEIANHMSTQVKTESNRDFYGLSKRWCINFFIFSVLSDTGENAVDNLITDGV